MKTLTDYLALAAAATSSVLAGELSREFARPPDSARPGVYWYFMDGNQDRDEMIADLHSMKKVGIGSVLFLEVDLGMPRGPVPFMSEAWQDNVAHAFVEAGKLGMEVILGTGPGWAGSGGSWVRAEDSMQHLVGSTLNVRGPGTLDQVLAVQPPHPPNKYAGMNPAHRAERDAWHQDVAVLAFPTPPATPATISEVNMKTLRDVLPYSIRQTQQRFVRSQAAYADPAPGTVIDPAKIINLSSFMGADGRIQWTIPEGEWTVMRFVARSTGQTTRPAPQTGHGFETNKFDASSYRRHWDNFQAKLLEKVIAEGGPLKPGVGLTTLHLDSWEMSSQNWTAGFREEFRKRRGYDPEPFYPAFLGLVVGDLEQTERFLWDLRKTSQELVIENYAEVIKATAREHGLLYSNEPYDMNPAGDLDLGAVADVPMCEFWNAPYDTQYSCIEAVSIAHTMGRPIVKAEAFTSSQEAFAKSPANLKNQTDWAFAIGINGIVFHTFQHQALGDQEQPGMTMGRYGIQWHRNQTFWNRLSGYHEYIARCSHLLRQGEAVADILYLTPEGVPHIFEAPEDATEGVARMRDKKGYAFDAVSPAILAARAKVVNGRITFPQGSSYRVLVLPNSPTMTPAALATIEALVQAGATVIGRPPLKSPSLVNYPQCDAELATLAKSIWGGFDAPGQVTRIDHGKGFIFWGGDLEPAPDADFPSYRATAAVLSSLGLAEDFASPSGKLRYIHRQTVDTDIYFVSNRTEESVVTEGVFRVAGRQPQLWDPVTGEMRPLPDYQFEGDTTRVPLSFAPLQSTFVVFQRAPAGVAPTSAPQPGNFRQLTEVARLDGPWDVSFEPKRGGPAHATFAQLVDWTERPEEGIRYYSGAATYRTTFDYSPSARDRSAQVWLDLGTVRELGSVRLNGRDLGTVWTAPWRVDITAALKPTGNQLEIEVINGWVNRLIGDMQPGNKAVRQLSWPSALLGGKTQAAGRYTFVTHHYYKADAPLRPAGVLGPVTIRETTVP